MPPQAQNDKHENEGMLSLPSGHDVPFRGVQPSDAPALQRFLGRCSERTIYLRFFGSLNEFTEEKAQYFAHTDGTDHFAFVAIDPDDQDEFDKRFKQVVENAAPALDLSQENPLSNELLFDWHQR
jgi:hypothetical protein